MPTIRNNQEYLNTGEAARLLEVTFITFKDIAERFGLKGRSFPGQGQRVFFLKDAVEIVKNTSSEPSAIEATKAKIIELQEQQ